MSHSSMIWNLKFKVSQRLSLVFHLIWCHKNENSSCIWFSSPCSVPFLFHSVLFNYSFGFMWTQATGYIWIELVGSSFIVWSFPKFRKITWVEKYFEYVAFIIYNSQWNIRIFCIKGNPQSIYVGFVTVFLLVVINCIYFKWCEYKELFITLFT